jgi:cytochrome c peroxidase
MHKLLICIIGSGLLLLHACKKDEPVTPFPQPAMVLPAHFPAPVYSFENNPLDPKKIEIGRRLFYDEALSATNTISCASCHKQEFAFSDAGNNVSRGINNQVGIRNSPALFNLVWKPLFMWDGGIVNLENQAIAPLTDIHEMGTTLNNVTNYLNSTNSYKNAFKEVFQVETITSKELLVSLAQFMATMVSWQSRYDNYYIGQLNALNQDEIKGLKLFRMHCASCHKEPLMTDYSFRRNGITITEIDSGRQRVTQKLEDRGKFMVPSLRNVSLSTPYMHDGRFESLEEVLDNYKSPESLENNDELILTGIDFSEDDKQLIILFLKTLTDDEFLKKSSFSNHD